MAASYGTAIAVQGGNMSKQLDERAAEALRKLGHSEDEIAELAEKNKALPDEANVVEKEDTTPEPEAPQDAPDKRTIWQMLGKAFGIEPQEQAPVASPSEEARKIDEVSPTTTAEPAATDATIGAKAEGDAPAEPEPPSAEGFIQAFGETVAKAVGDMVREELDKRDARIAALEQQIKRLDESVEEKVERRLQDMPPVTKVAASQVAATAIEDATATKGLTFGNPQQGMQDYTKSLLADIERVVKDKVAQFQV